jgi:hypothetical protein
VKSRTLQALEKSQLPAHSNRAIIEFVEFALEDHIALLSTKSDLDLTAAKLRSEMQEMKVDLRSEIGALRVEMKSFEASMKSFEASMKGWMFASFLAQTGVLFTALHFALKH